MKYKVQVLKIWVQKMGCVSDFNEKNYILSVDDQDLHQSEVDKEVLTRL